MSESNIPFDRLGIPEPMRKHVEPGAPIKVRMAAAKGLVPTTIDVQLALCTVLFGDDDEEVRAAAGTTARTLPGDAVAAALHQRTHPKILEMLAFARPGDSVVGARILTIRDATHTAAITIARNASTELCERIAINQERLLITPRVILALNANENCPEESLERVRSFLRMHRELPDDLPPCRPWEAEDTPVEGVSEEEASEANPIAMDLEAEIEAALRGERSPALQAETERRFEMFDVDKLLDGDSEELASMFNLDFATDSTEFGWDLTEEPEEHEPEKRKTVEQTIAGLSVGERVKLAYRGNKESRQVLVRDRNRVVAVAVVRSGRCTDGEVATMAANRNLHDDVLREIATNREWMRKYPVRVALVNNPKCPVSVAVSIVRNLQKRDLMELSRNHNVSSVVAGLALRTVKEKFKKN